MENPRKGRIALVELLIAFLFFALSSVIILRLFVTGRQLGQDSARQSAALALAQSWAERLYAAPDMEKVLLENGWTADTSPWTEQAGYRIDAEGLVGFVRVSGQTTQAGALHSANVSFGTAQASLTTLPCVRYEGGDAP